MPETRMKIAYIHDSPLFERLDTDYRNPHKLLELGFTDVVLSDQMRACLFGITPEGIGFIGMIINVKSDNKLISLRKEKMGYKIQNGKLFNFVSCPNY